MSTRLHPVLTPPPVAAPEHHERRDTLAHPPGRHRWLERLARFGLVVRGFIYFLPGAFALETALGRQQQPLNQASTITLIGRQPMGRVLLIVVALGLVGYIGWGIRRAFFDAQHRGRSPGGLVARFGYAMSAIAYTGLLLATVRLLIGTPIAAPHPVDWSVTLMSHPFGGIAVGIVGLCWIFGSGIAQIVTGWHRRFERDLVLERMGRTERRFAIGLGRVGLVARGFVFTIIGVLLVAAALHRETHSTSGLEGALLELARQPFGRVLVIAAATGLMVFGAYSALCSRWMRMPSTATAALPAPSRRDAS